MRIKNRLVAALSAGALVFAGGVGSTAPAAAIITDHDHNLSKCGAVKGMAKLTIDGLSATSPYYATQRYGNKNRCVGQIQYLLNDGFCNSSTKLAVDNVYGPKTRTAVLRLQQEWAEDLWVNGKKLKKDGVVGPQTWALLTTWNLGGGRVSCK